jgi:glycosyltransferase involved in cell wall biosynthesis
LKITSDSSFVSPVKTGRITFLLPGATHVPVGGYKVIYEYANRLTERGHQITVVHPAFLTKGSSLFEVGRSVARYVKKKFIGYRPDSWFEVDPAVELRWVPSLSARYIPDADAVIATAWQTAEWSATYPNSKGRKFYLIQGLEKWHGMERRATATWRLPLQKLVIARYLMDFAGSLGENAVYQPNGLDFTKFYMAKPPEDRDPASVMMLYHSSEGKGSADGLKAFSIVQREIPSLRITLFGTPQRPPDLSASVHYYRCPEQGVLRDLYNDSAIFVGPSWTEGWALPPAEAMTCGAALVATDIGGHRDYGIPEQTALLSPLKAPEGLAENILRLIRDQSLRIRFARNGHQHVHQFSWERSVSQLESVLFRSVEKPQLQVNQYG